jgi:CrcB protein
MTLALIAVGGALGALARYGAGRALEEQSRAFPVATLLVNLSGAFALGFLSLYLLERVPTHWRNGINGGFLGAFTTFSTLSLEGVRLLEDGRALDTLGYIAASVIGGLALAWLGQRLAATL